MGARIATSIINGLKSQPLILALVVVNVLFLIGCAYGLREISASAARRDMMLADEIAKDCTAAPKGDRLKP
jgi:hypothetical protein